MNTSANNFDAIENLIYEEGLRIEAVNIHPSLDVMLIILNTKAILKQKISAYKSFQNRPANDILNYEIIAGGTGIHWPLIDEDLSLKGFLEDKLRNFVKISDDVAA
jgi:Protein of unknown function (DUF2442)